MTFIDWFAGIGGFRRGMELAGHTCIGFCEFDPHAVRSYISMHLLTEEERQHMRDMSLHQAQKYIDNTILPEIQEREWYASDIRAVRDRDIPHADCWCFGFPCQDISVAGMQLGFQGQRSSLFFRVMRLIQDLQEEDRPTYLFIENVKNLLSVNGGADFLKLLIALDESGYDGEWQVINSADYVPQNRERIFIMGHLRGRGSKKVFPIPRATGKGVIHQVGNVMPSRKRDNPNQGRLYSPEGISPTLTKAEGGGRTPYVFMFCDMGYGAGLKVTQGARCLQARYNKGISNRGWENSGVAVLWDKGSAIPVLTPERGKKRQNGRRMKTRGEPMFSLTTQDVHGAMLGIKVKEATKRGYAIATRGDSVNIALPNSKTRRGRVGKGIVNTLDTSCNQGIVIHIGEDYVVHALWNEEYQRYVAIRRLTPKECFRLQGWEDIYFHRAALVSSETQLYRQAGNGVTVDVIREIGVRL